MNADRTDYDSRVTQWRAALTNQECRDLYADWRKGSTDPATIDGAMEYVARREARSISRGTERRVPRQGKASAGLSAARGATKTTPRVPEATGPISGREIA